MMLRINVNTMINWVGLESVQLKKSAIDWYIANKVKCLHCATSGYSIGFLREKFRFWSEFKTKKKNQELNFLVNNKALH